MLVAIIACTPLAKRLHYVLLRKEVSPTTAYVYHEVVTPLLNFALVAISIALLIGKSYNPFLYFRF